MTANPNIGMSVAIDDPNNPAHTLAPNADGSLNVDITGGSGGGGSVGTATYISQVKVATTGTAVPLASSSTTLTQGVVVTANSSNVGTIFVGGSGVINTGGGTGNGYLLVAGASVSIPINNLNAVYINGTANDFVSYVGV